MTDRHSHPSGPDGSTPDGEAMDRLPDPGSMSPGVRLRAVADGELGSEHAADHEAGAVAFERRLRASVAAAMRSPETSSPEGLIDRVRDAIARDRGPEAATDHGVTDPGQERSGAEAHTTRDTSPEPADAAGGLADRLERRAEHTRSRTFWSRPALAAGAGIAAALAALFGLIVVNGAGPGGPGGIGGGTVAAGEGYTVRLAQFVAGEHDRVTASPAAARHKLFVRSHDDAVERMMDRLGAPGSMQDLRMARDALRFRGLGDCAVPGDAPSCHAQFTLVSPSGRESVVSLFLKRAEGLLDLEPGVTYEVDTGACGVEGSRIIVWSDGELVHVLVASDPAGEVCDEVLDDMGLPMPTARLL